jgi:hypothetical protein
MNLQFYYDQIKNKLENDDYFTYEYRKIDPSFESLIYLQYLYMKSRYGTTIEQEFYDICVPFDFEMDTKKLGEYKAEEFVRMLNKIKR